ncbi:MAG: FG-GAP-like repeat-containing protein [Ignavibacteria bacterium]|nr:FG-GAP-like repeat-containing protein [Ignavibacteria bacterium]
MAKSQVTFTDVSGQLGVNDPGAAQGCVFVDVNNDGFLDIFLVNNNNQNKLYINVNGTSFVESSVAWNVAVTAPGRGISCADFNNDGFIDVAVGNYNSPIILYKNLGTSFSDVSISSGVNLPGYGGSINWIDYNNDGKIDFLFANDGIPPHYNYLFRNNNLINFTNVAYQSGLVDSLSTLAIAAADYNNDGLIDFFVGSQSVQPAVGTGILYKNNGDGTFTDVTVSSGLVTFNYTWGAEWGDYNNDGYMDIALANTNFNSQVFRNNGDGTFTEVTDSLGISDCAQSYSTGWADVDNDGDLDLYFARGQNTADKLYRNNGNGTFTDISGTAGTNDLRHSSCISWGDYNNDGYLDLYLNNNGTANRLYKNNGETKNNWLIMNLQGTNTNRSAIGTRVTVKTGNITQIREVEGGSGGKGQNSLPVEFGIKQSVIIDTLIVKWYSGLTQTFTNVTPNMILNLTEGGTIGIQNNTGILPAKFELSQNYPNPFNPVTTIKYALPKSSFVNISVYDMLGRKITELVNSNRTAGTYEVKFNADNISSGVYLYKLTAGDFYQVKKMIILK